MIVRCFDYARKAKDPAWMQSLERRHAGLQSPAHGGLSLQDQGSENNGETSGGMFWLAQNRRRIAQESLCGSRAVSYTHLTLPTTAEV